MHRRVLDAAELITPVDILKYVNSPHAAEMNELLITNERLPNYRPSKRIYTATTNHTITILSIGNAHRSGIMLNFTLESYGTKHARLAHTVFTIEEHKTVGPHGAASLVLDAEEARLLEGYMIWRKNLPWLAHPKIYVCQQ